MADASRPRRLTPALFVRLALMLVLSFAIMVRPAAAQSILRDAETEALLHEISKPLIEASGLRPEDVQVVLVGDSSINAFVAGGQIVYIHSGLLDAAADVNEVQGVIAHELGHITGGHIIRYADGAKAATSIMLISLLLGAAAMAAGGGEAGMGIMSAGQQAATGRFYSFLSVQESSADQAGASFLSKAGISGKGSIAFFKKIQNQELRYGIPQDESYFRTHPLSGTRIANLEASYRSDPAWDKNTDPKIEERFKRIQAKLFGFMQDSKRTLQKYPESDKSTEGHYARAYAWHKSAYPDRAEKEIDALLARDPNDPYFLELKGQILLESGRPADALDSLRKAVALQPSPLIAALFGHALIATEDPKNFEEAKKVLRNAVTRDNSNPFAWYQLGIVYDREGDQARAALATAERYNLQGQPRLALVSAENAMLGIPRGTPDWIRAQDIAMVSRTAVEKKKK